jgi:hypothetical protein
MVRAKKARAGEERIASPEFQDSGAERIFSNPEAFRSIVFIDPVSNDLVQTCFWTRPELLVSQSSRLDPCLPRVCVCERNFPGASGQKV